MGKEKQKLIVAGWINDRTYPVHNTDESRVNNSSPSKTATYQAWTCMKRRCIDNKYKEKYPTYIGVDASAEFKNFTLFHDWWFNQIGHDLPDIQLDKDLLVKGNKFYSPDTCLLIPNFVNKFLIKRNASRGDCLIGVDKHDQYKNGDVRYRAGVSVYDLISGKTGRRHLGCFRNELDAFQAYKTEKEKIAKKYANYLQGKVDDRVVQALLDFEVNIKD